MSYFCYLRDGKFGEYVLPIIVAGIFLFFPKFQRTKLFDPDNNKRYSETNQYLCFCRHLGEALIFLHAKPVSSLDFTVIYHKNVSLFLNTRRGIISGPMINQRY